MVRENELRPSEVAVTPPPPTDAGLLFIGRIRTPWTSRLVTPRQGRPDGPICRMEIFDPWVPALDGLERWKARYPEAARHLAVDDVLVDGMRGRSSTWTRVRVNLRHVPEALRPSQETPDPDDDPTREWREKRASKKLPSSRKNRG